MGDIRNCPRCGKIFGYIGRPICNSCMQDEEDEFKKVKEYVYENPGANMAEVSQATEISVDKIMRFLRDERLEITGDDSNMILECERCSKAIKTGRFCDHCKDDMASGFKKEFGIGNKPEPRQEPDKKSDRDKMFTATRRR